MKNSIIVLAILLFPSFCYSQVKPPYYQDFENGFFNWQTSSSSNTNYWKIEAEGEDGDLDKFGDLGNQYLTVKFPYSCGGSAYHELITPYFDLSEKQVELFISFKHKFSSQQEARILVYYSINNEGFKVLNDLESDKLNWPFPAYTRSDGRTVIYGTPQGNLCSHSLGFLQGNDSVRFKFRYSTPQKCDPYYYLDDFSIDIPRPNIEVLNEKETVYIINPSQGIRFDIWANITRHRTTYADHTINLYLSKDTVLDDSDVLVKTKVRNLSFSTYISEGLFSGDEKLYLDSDVEPGQYYIIYEVEPSVELPEICLEDNIGYVKLIIGRSELPILNPVNDTSDFFYINNNKNIPGNWIKLDAEDTYRIEPYSGSMAWYFQPNNSYSNYKTLYTPVFDFNQDSNNYCFCARIFNYDGKMLLAKFSNKNEKERLTLEGTGKNKWESICFDISEMKTWINPNIGIISTNETVYRPMTGIDDIYIGLSKPDLALIKQEHAFTPKNQLADTFYFQIENVGIVESGSFSAMFYFSKDSILDSNDILISDLKELTISSDTILTSKFGYTKAELLDFYYIHYVLDYNNSVDEMWEENNVGFVKINSGAVHDSLYFNDFEGDVSDWFIDDIFAPGMFRFDFPQGLLANHYQWNTKCLLFDETNPNLNYVHSYAYSPIFNIDSIKNPVISYDFKKQYINVDYIEYSNDGGASWHDLTPTNNSFEDPSIYFYDKYFIPNIDRQKVDKTDKYRDDRFSIDITHLKGRNVRFRLRAIEHSSQVPRGYDNFRISDGVSHPEFKSTYSFLLPNQEKNFILESVLHNQYDINIDSINLNYYLSNDSILDNYDTLILGTLIYDLQPGFIYNHIDSVNLDSQFYRRYCITAMELKDSVYATEFSSLLGDTIRNIPYFNNFSSYNQKGWKSYSTNMSLRIIHSDYTGSPWVAENDPWFYDLSSRVPTMYLETPSFDFSNDSILYLSFILKALGSSFEGFGSNMEYSLDGGFSWRVLGRYQDTLGFNWYDDRSILYLNSQPGWTQFLGNRFITSFNIGAYVAGEPNVIFRFKYRFQVYHAYTLGFTMDEFRISNIKPVINLKVINSKNPHTLTKTYDDHNFEIDITNIGNIESGDFFLDMYYSKDTIFDYSDIYLGKKGFTNVPVSDTVTLKFSHYIENCLDSFYLLSKISHPERVSEAYQLPIIATEKNYAYTNFAKEINGVSFFECSQDTIRICPTQQIRLSVPEYQNYKYNWSDLSTKYYNQITNPGWNKVSVNDRNNCFYGADSVFVELYPINAPSLGIDINLTHDTIILKNNTGNQIYWQNGDISNFLNIADKDYYYFEFRDSNNCTVRSEPIYNAHMPDGGMIKIIGGDSIFCHGDSVVLASVIAKSYNWSTGDTLSSVSIDKGGYVVLQCYYESLIVTDSIKVRVVEFPDPGLGYRADSICFGDTLSIWAEIDSDNSYRWSTGDTTNPLIVDFDGDYWVDITREDRCTTNSDTVNIGLFPRPIKPIVEQAGVKLLINSEQEDLFIWQNPDLTADSTISRQYLPQFNGVYQLASLNKYGCMSESTAIEFIKPEQIEFGSVFPNPVFDEFMLFVVVDSDLETKITIHNVVGELIYEDTFILSEGNNFISLNYLIASLPFGLNFIKVSNEEGEKIIPFIRQSL